MTLLDSGENILMVASGVKKKKKDYMTFDTENLYLNYGLLGLGSILSKKGYKVSMFQGDNKMPPSVITEIISMNINISNMKYPIFISVPSFFAISWANEFIDCVKLINPSVKIVLGGRWVIDENLSWVREKMPKVDFFSLGCPDEIIEDLLFPRKWSYNTSQQFTNKPFDNFDYSILYNYKIYQPSIELSRGCGCKCDFCLEKDNVASEIKPAKIVINYDEGTFRSSYLSLQCLLHHHFAQTQHPTQLAGTSTGFP